MSIAETAAGWGRDIFDRWTGLGRSLHCASLEKFEASEEILPRTPLLKPRNLAVSSPPPLSLPPAMRLNLSPLQSQTLANAVGGFCSYENCSSCVAPTPTRGTPRSPLLELKTEINRSSSPDTDSSPSLGFRAKAGASKRIKGNSPSFRGLSQTKWGGDKVAKENTEQQSTVAVVSPLKRKRPPKLQIPSSGGESEVVKPDHMDVPMDISAEGKGYGIHSKKGHREVLEDAYQAVLDIDGNSRHAFFGIFDGHGGRVAAEFAADNLSRNIRDALDNGERDLEAAVRVGYLSTDAAFLKKQLSSGASCVTAFIRDGSLVVANAGDCRAVMSRNGVAVALTEDHRLAREDERRRVEDLGGYVDLYSGVWRLQGVLAVSRGIGDIHLKRWVSAEPEIQKLAVDEDCEFLLLASDGLWDVVSNQEAVDCVGDEIRSAEMSSVGGLAASTKKLAELAASRGSQDDISVMAIDLRHFRNLRADVSH
ncbi:probable protein phosphatase 2C 2 [Selaginella moellendorffii]|nr:probable protein phosphatase 2C 2 [Selaginella moellendorffii]|eukprot:XP_002987519.2 probable protein phosphatase 2C 2 [Selaginella moellendorffii]